MGGAGLGGDLLMSTWFLEKCWPILLPICGSLIFSPSAICGLKGHSILAGVGSLPSGFKPRGKGKLFASALVP